MSSWLVHTFRVQPLNLKKPNQLTVVMTIMPQHLSILNAVFLKWINGSSKWQKKQSCCWNSGTESAEIHQSTVSTVTQRSSAVPCCGVGTERNLLGKFVCRWDHRSTLRRVTELPVTMVLAKLVADIDLPLSPFFISFSCVTATAACTTRSCRWSWR